LSVRWTRAAGLERYELTTLLYLAQLLTEENRRGAAHDILVRVDELAHERNLPRTRLKALNRLALLFSELGDTRQTLAIDRKSVALCMEMGEAHYVPRIWLNIADAFMALGRLDSCDTAIKQAKRWAKDYPHFQTDWAVLATDADLQLLSGNLAAADSLRRLAAEADPDMRLRGEEIYRLLAVIEHGREMGRATLAFSALHELESLCTGFPGKIPGQDMVIDYLLVAAGLRTDVGEYDRAKVLLDESAERLAGSPDPRKHSRYWAMRALLAEARDDRNSALAARDSSLHHAEVAGDPGMIAREAILRSRVLLEAGRVGEARRQLEEGGGAEGRCARRRIAAVDKQQDCGQGKQKYQYSRNHPHGVILSRLRGSSAGKGSGKMMMIRSAHPEPLHCKGNE